jgi:predicted nucleic acid-binding protein
MADFFLDTAIIVDLLRSHPPSVQWKNAQGQAILGITPTVWMEIVDGAMTKIAQQRAIKLLQQFEMVYFTQVDLDWAMRQQLSYHLSYNAGINDCLIASVPYRLQRPLYTHNLKHFAPLLGSLAQKPYT